MKKYLGLLFILLLLLTIVILIVYSFTNFSFNNSNGNMNSQSGDAAYSASKDQSVQSYNISVQKEVAVNRFACDTIALQEYILVNYPAGSYLVQFDRTFTLNIPKYAVIYKKLDADYVFAAIVKSKEGERNIETKNIIGYESSFINLDSTKLGTAFFFLTLFQCVDSSFQMIWEKEIPIHGGFNQMTYAVWKNKNIPYVSLNFEDGIIVGHRDYNVFMCDGLKAPPHLLETYEGISHKRTMANINNDQYPDYFEFNFLSTANRIASEDSVAFLWDVKKNLYYNTRNPKQTRFF
ncbi:MAG: hypothetical protein WCJ01_08535 [Ignavibacteria bacterium]